MSDRDIKTLTNDEVSSIEYYYFDKEAGIEDASEKLKSTLIQAGFSISDNNDMDRKASLIIALWYNYF